MWFQRKKKTPRAAEPPAEPVPAEVTITFVHEYQQGYAKGFMDGVHRAQNWPTVDEQVAAGKAIDDFRESDMMWFQKMRQMTQTPQAVVVLESEHVNKLVAALKVLEASNESD